MCTFTSPQALSADAALTQERVRSFYKYAVDAQKSGMKPAIKFFKEHLHDQSVIKMHSIAHLQGAPEKKEFLNLDKEQVLQQTQQTYNMGNLEEMTTTVLAVVIDDARKSAKVKSTSYVIYKMGLQTMQGSGVFRTEQSMLCDDVLELNSDNIIQIKDTTCSVEVNMKPLK